MGRFRTAAAIAGALGLMPVAAVVAPLGVPHAQAATTDLYFSEYIEGSSNNKALEIFNGTGAAIDLARRWLQRPDVLQRQPGRRRLTINLTGTVADGDVFVVAQAVGQRDDPRPGRPDQRLGLVQRRRRRRAAQGHRRSSTSSVRSVSTPARSGAPGSSARPTTRCDGRPTVCQGDPNGADVFDPAIGVGRFRHRHVRRTGCIHRGCGVDSVPRSRRPSPVSGASGVARDANIVVTFSEPVNVDRIAGSRSPARPAARTPRP